MTDANQVHARTRQVIDRINGAAGLLEQDQQLLKQVAGEVNGAIGGSAQKIDQELIALASQASTLISDAVAGLRTASNAATEYLEKNV